VLLAIGLGAAGLAFHYAVLGSAVSMGMGPAELGCHDAAVLSAPALWVWRVCYYVIGPGAMGVN
jgi:hypothetical protein